jgi:hypothetical protein
LRARFTRKAVPLGYLAGQALVWHALVVLTWGLEFWPPAADAESVPWLAWLWLQLNTVLVLTAFLQACLGDPGVLLPLFLNPLKKNWFDHDFLSQNT